MNFKKTLAAVALTVFTGSAAYADDANTPNTPVAPAMNFDQATCIDPVQNRSFLEFMDVILQMSGMVKEDSFDMPFVFVGSDNVPRATSLIELNHMNPKKAADMIIGTHLTYFAMKDSDNAKEEDSFSMASSDQMCSVSKETYEAVKAKAQPVPKLAVKPAP